MKVLFINLPYSGHIIPTIGLVEELVAREISVTYVLTEEWKESIEDTGADFEEYEDSRKLSVQIRNAYEKAISIAKDFDVIVYEQFFFLGKHIAEKVNKPAVRIFTSPASNEKIMRSYLESGGVFSIFRNKWICKNWTKDVTKGITLKTECWLREIIENPPRLNLVYTIREFQPYEEQFSKERYKFIGASIYIRDDDVPKEIINIKEDNKTLIYISLGTIVNKAKKFYKQCFRAFENEDVNVILSIGKNINVEELGNIPDNFKVYQHVPQLEVLKKADIFVTHGGLNSVTEAIYFGVPMVVLPVMTDQPLNARQVCKCNIGKMINPKKVNINILHDTVFDVLEDEGIKYDMKVMQGKMQKSGGNSYAANAILNIK